MGGLVLVACLAGLPVAASVQAQGAPALPVASARQGRDAVLLFVQGFDAALESGLRADLGRSLDADAVDLTDPRATAAVGTVAVARSREGAVLQVAPRGKPTVVLSLPHSYLGARPSVVIARAVQGVWPGLEIDAGPAQPAQANRPCHPQPAPFAAQAREPASRPHTDVLDPWAPFPPRRRSATLREVHDPWRVGRL